MPVKRQLLDPSLEGQMQTLRSVQDVLQSVAQTTSYTLVLTDRGKVIDFNSASAVVLTVPLNSSVVFPIGTVINIARLGAGTVTVTGAVGVTIRTALSLTLRVQYSEASLRKIGTDEWLLSGDLT